MVSQFNCYIYLKRFMRQLLVKLEVETTNINTISSPCASVTDFSVVLFSSSVMH